MPILFPVLISDGNELVAFTRDHFIRYGGFRHEEGNRYSYPESGSSKPLHYQWLVDGNGCFRELREVGVLRKWARPFNVIWRVSRCLVELSEPQRISRAALLQRVSELPKKDHARDLMRYLRQKGAGKDADREFTRADFREFMAEPADRTDETLP